MWGLTKIHERLRTERIRPFSIRIFQVYVTCCLQLEYSRILLRHNHILESRILYNILAFTQRKVLLNIILIERGRKVGKLSLFCLLRDRRSKR